MTEDSNKSFQTELAMMKKRLTEIETQLKDGAGLPVVKNCVTCRHAIGNFDVNGYCMVSGLHQVTERLHKTMCDSTFSRWEPIIPQPTIFQKVSKLWSK